MAATIQNHGLSNHPFSLALWKKCAKCAADDKIYIATTLLVRPHSVIVVDVSVVHDFYQKSACPYWMPRSIAIVGVVRIRVYEVTVVVVDKQIQIGVPVARYEYFGVFSTIEYEFIDVVIVGFYALIRFGAMHFGAYGGRRRRADDCNDAAQHRPKKMSLRLLLFVK